MLEISDLRKSFATPRGTIDVLAGVNFSIDAGERLAIVGSSGAGKTTLMHILGGLDQPSAGEVRFEGTALATLGDAELDRFRNQTIGFVFQFNQLLPEFTALENVMMPLLIGGLKRSEASERAAAILDEVRLSK